ncbi:dihydroorotate dehydrogenase electron transfer subunit [candidate division KSB1 bacterium]|nr:dihydroorotate dehydrogenase electron transfer subunit [candidate division KSB1 bacterium]
MYIESCEILTHEAITKTVYRIVVSSERLARECYPGQFLHVKVREAIDPLLRRPLSVHRVIPKKNTIELLYRVVGHGTRLMSGLKSGELLNVMGPLGNGFDLETPFDHAVIVAGGMGGAPVFFLIDTLLDMGKQVTLIWGVGDGKEIFGIETFKARGVDVQIATEDGTVGKKGLVTDLLIPFLAKEKNNSTLCGFVCGPECMLSSVQKLAGKTSFPWQASLEERMACGIGVCRGCGVQLRNADMKMVCDDGPVFNLKEIYFEA